jgi:hypothetical protein
VKRRNCGVILGNILEMERKCFERERKILVGIVLQLRSEIGTSTLKVIGVAMGISHVCRPYQLCVNILDARSHCKKASGATPSCFTDSY